MIMAGTSIKINQYRAKFKRLQKLVEAKTTEHKDPGVEEKFVPLFTFNIGLHIKAIEQLSSCLMKQINKTPARLRIQLS